MRFVHVLTLAVLAISLSSPAAHAASPAAVVLEISDAQDAQITAPSEIRGGTTIALGKTGRIKFVHYLSCDEVTAIGGTVSVSAVDVAATGSQITRTKTACPELIALSQMQPRQGFCPDCAMPLSVVASSHPTILFVGGQVQDVKLIRLTSRSTGVKIDLKMIDSRVALPEVELPDDSYFFQVFGRTANTPLFAGHVNGFMLGVSSQDHQNPLVIIRVN